MSHRVRRLARLRLARLLVVGLAVALSSAACVGSRAAVDGSVTRIAPADREPAPRVQGELLDGPTYDLTQLRGQVVVLNVWGSWCGPCQAEAEELQQVFTATRAEGVQFVGINVRDSATNARSFHRDYGITYPSFFDPAGRILLRFDAVPPSAVPSTLVLDRRGRVAARFLGPVLAEELEPVVRAVAAGSLVEPSGRSSVEPTADSSVEPNAGVEERP